MAPVVFLSAPYSHPDVDVMEDRVRMVAETGARIEESGQGHIIAPILTNHLMCRFSQVPKETAWWEAQFLALLGRCDEMWVLRLDGWDRSVGVASEIRHAEQRGIPIKFVDFGEV